MRVKSRKPPAELDHFGLGHLFDVSRGADDVEGDQMWYVAGDGQHDVVVLRRHGLDRRAKPAPQRGDLLDRRVAASLARGDDAPAAVEQFGEARVRPGMFSAGDRVGGDEVRAPSGTNGPRPAGDGNGLLGRSRHLLRMAPGLRSAAQSPAASVGASTPTGDAQDDEIGGGDSVLGRGRRRPRTDRGSRRSAGRTAGSA